MTKEIKPKSVTTKKKKKNTSCKVGLAFEKKITKKCDEYNLFKRAYIHKIPTDVAVIRRGATIIDCIFRDKASLDFCGVLSNGKSVYIEAKTCQSKTSFPLSLIKDHQFNIAFDLLNYTNLVFFLIEMREIDKTYLVNAKDVKEFIDSSDRKSFPVEWLDKKGMLIDNKEFDFIAPIEIM